jgi:rubrerythrin
MTPVEALELALSKENASIELYSRLADEHNEIRDLLFELLNEEEKHKKMIEEKIRSMTKY